MKRTTTRLNRYTVYMHICPNGKRYIGITGLYPKDRWKNGANYKFNRHFTSAGSISKCCRGVKYFVTAGGYHWAFAKEAAL